MAECQQCNNAKGGTYGEESHDDASEMKKSPASRLGLLSVSSRRLKATTVRAGRPDAEA